MSPSGTRKFLRWVSETQTSRTEAYALRLACPHELTLRGLDARFLLERLRGERCRLRAGTVPDGLRDPRAQDVVPKPAREPERSCGATRAVVVPVVEPDVLEVAPSEPVEVNRVVNPLFDHVTLEQSRHGYRCRVVGPEEKTHDHEEGPKGQRVQVAIDVHPVPGSLVMVPVHRVEELVDLVLEPPLPVG